MTMINLRCHRRLLPIRAWLARAARAGLCAHFAGVVACSGEGVPRLYTTVQVANPTANPATNPAAQPVPPARAPSPDPEPPAREDLRAYMHGIEAVKGADGRYTLFFSSADLPPHGPEANGNWTHDVYVSHWSSVDAKITAPKSFIRRPEAQEPVSAARTGDGHVMVTFEDGWDTAYSVDQRYGVYDAKLRPVAAYPLEVRKGGHSGHVAAVGQRFVVFYSEDWVQGGGVDNLGSGKGVYARVYDSAGRPSGAEIEVAPRVREWWPMIAGSPTRALLVWQQFVAGKTHANLKIALLDPKTGAVTRRRVLRSQVQYYTYKADYVPAIDRFLVTGTTAAGSGFAYLIDNDGRRTASLACMPATVREGGIAVNGAMAYTPARDNRLLHLSLTPRSIALAAVQPSPIAWSYIGSVGLMRDATQIHWVSLGKSGLQETDFNTRDATQPTAADRCEVSDPARRR